jgi:uncharacterized tellurite resistance protein B-like protein
MSIIQRLKQSLNVEPAASSETDTVRKITQALDKLEPERAKFIAAFAYILSRVARADLQISPEETEIMERIVMDRGEMPQEQAILVIQIAKTQNLLFGGTENYLVSREFNALAGHREKIALLHCLFTVAAADDSIATIEDNEISQIADELRIEHRDFIAVRSQFRDYLEVLKNSRKI